MIFPPNEVQVVLTMHASRVQEFAEWLRRSVPGGPSTGSLLARVIDQFEQQGHGARLAVVDVNDVHQIDRLHEQVSGCVSFDSLQTALREYATPLTYRTDTTGNRPWPDVDECHSSNVGHECPQCAWTHIHDWVAWNRRDGKLYAGVPIRCTKCGGRKCDRDECALQRHHGVDHSGVQA